MTQASTTSRGGSTRIGPGGNGELIWENSSNSMGRTMTGSRVAALSDLSRSDDQEILLADVATLDPANQFLEGYLPICNQRFTVQPAQVADLHRPRPAHREWTASCASRRPLPAQGFHHCASEERYQIHAMVRAHRVLVGEHGDGTMRPMKTAEAKTVYQPRRPVTPRPDHPWRQRLRPERRTEATVARP